MFIVCIIDSLSQLSHRLHCLNVFFTGSVIPLSTFINSFFCWKTTKRHKAMLLCVMHLNVFRQFDNQRHSLVDNRCCDCDVQSETLSTRQPLSSRQPLLWLWCSSSVWQSETCSSRHQAFMFWWCCSLYWPYGFFLSLTIRDISLVVNRCCDCDVQSETLSSRQSLSIRQPLLWWWWSS